MEVVVITAATRVQSYSQIITTNKPNVLQAECPSCQSTKRNKIVWPTTTITTTTTTTTTTNNNNNNSTVVVVVTVEAATAAEAIAI